MVRCIAPTRVWHSGEPRVRSCRSAPSRSAGPAAAAALSRCQEFPSTRNASRSCDGVRDDAAYASPPGCRGLPGMGNQPLPAHAPHSWSACPLPMTGGSAWKLTAATMRATTPRPWHVGQRTFTFIDASDTCSSYGARSFLQRGVPGLPEQAGSPGVPRTSGRHTRRPEAPRRRHGSGPHPSGPDRRARTGTGRVGRGWPSGAVQEPASSPTARATARDVLSFSGRPASGGRPAGAVAAHRPGHHSPNHCHVSSGRPATGQPVGRGNRRTCLPTSPSTAMSTGRPATSPDVHSPVEKICG